LIPRPETEFLVEKIYQFYDKNSKIKILDIGTGSGCIAIELARFYSSAEITAVDICQETLDVAKKNAKKFNFDTKIDFKKSDLFENINDRFDIIVSNPPYIAENDEVQYDVDKYEPHRALYASESGLYFYKHIIQQASEYMLPNSHIAFEVGLKQAISVTSLLEENNFVNIELTKDCDSVDRVVSAVFLA
jgi:release factor glutamine methyltransferase